MTTTSSMAAVDAEIARLLASGPASDTQLEHPEAGVPDATPFDHPPRVRKPRKDKGVKRGPSPTGGKKRAKGGGQKPTKTRKVKARPESDDEDGDGEDSFKKRIGSTRHDVRHYAKVKSAAGCSSLDCADRVAQELRGMDLDAVYAKVAKTLGETQTSLREKYKHLNPGMQRMNLGNRYRAALAE